MKLLVRERRVAIDLRRRGMSYRDILKAVPVAKSTLSQWLCDLPLTKQEKAYLKSRTDSNITRGRIKAAAALRANRIGREKADQVQAKIEFERFLEAPFFLIGVALYWAEGAKRSSGFEFVNSDDEMVSLMVKWVEMFLDIPRARQKARLYIHKPYAHENLEKRWALLLGIPIGNFQKTIYKPTGLLVKKRPQYKGCLRLEISGIRFMRKMQYWQNFLFALFVKKGTLS